MTGAFAQPAAEPEPAPTDAEYGGEPVDLSFQQASVRAVLQILADYQGFNLIATEAVSGEITVQMSDVPWDQALELVLQSQGLGSRLAGNVLFVAPLGDIELLELETRMLAPLLTDYIQVNYADAEDIVTLLTGAAAAERAEASATDAAPEERTGPGSGLLSNRGSARVDSRTNIIIVRDIASKLEEIRALVARLDIPVRQVLIEARIVNVSTDFGHELGIRWGGAGANENGFRYGGSQHATVEQANLQAAREVARQNALLAGNAARLEALQDRTDPALIEALVNQAIASVPIPVGEVTFPEALAIDLGVPVARASAFSIGYTGDDGLIELELSALESSGNGEVIARPRVTTQDKVTAEIRSGVRIPYQSQAGGTAGGSTTEFEDAVLALSVTPRITPDGRINMDLAIQQDSVAVAGGTVPAINTNQVSTQVLVGNGETIVLGGVFREEYTITESKTPVLGDLPWIGRLFKYSANETRRTELLIFITPRIINETAAP